MQYYDILEMFKQKYPEMADHITRHFIIRDEIGIGIDFDDRPTVYIRLRNDTPDGMFEFETLKNGTYENL